MKIYAVGGSVRDTLMGRKPKDHDYVVIGSTPEEMLSLGYQKVGSDFPVFLHPDTKEEYALARIERKVGNGYNGFKCTFGPNVTIEDDLSRRDLTINSIARDIDTGEIIDPFNGRADIKSKILRHTSDAFADDPLRVIRLARFFARFGGFTIAPDTIDLVRKVVDSGEMNHLTPERYWAELIKVFSDSACNVAKFFSCLQNFGVLKNTYYFIDLLGDFHDRTLGTDFTVTCAKITLMISNPELQVAVFVALFEKNAGMNVRALPNRVRTLVENFRKIKLIDFGKAEDVYGIIAGTRSLNETSPAFMDLVCCIRYAGDRNNAIFLERANSAVHQVKSDAFMGMSGKEIGSAMKSERIRLISEICQ